MPGKFNFTIFGGLEKKHYMRFRELKKRHGLDDRGLVECLVELALHNDPTQLSLIATDYKVTAPVDVTLPEVV